MKQNSLLFTLSLFLLLVSCDFKSEPYLKHELNYEKIGGDCTRQNSQVNVDANTIGERYIFQECLETSFRGDYSVLRQGDTVVVNLGGPGASKALYQITLDINTRPTYHFLTVNGNTIAVTVTRD